jgi:hypothetical protein
MLHFDYKNMNTSEDELYCSQFPWDTSLLTFLVSICITIFISLLSFSNGGRFDLNGMILECQLQFPAENDMEVEVKGDECTENECKKDAYYEKIKNILQIKDGEFYLVPTGIIIKNNPNDIDDSKATKAIKYKVNKKSSRVIGQYKYENVNFIFEHTIKDFTEKLDNIKTSKPAKVQSLASYSEPYSVIIWMLMESILISISLTVIMRIFLVRRYRDKLLSVPITLSQDPQGEPWFVKTDGPPKERDIADQMSQIIKCDNKFRDIKHVFSKAIPDVLAVTLITPETYIPTSFIRVWAEQANVLRNPKKQEVVSLSDADNYLRTLLRETYKIACTTAKLYRQDDTVCSYFYKENSEEILNDKPMMFRIACVTEHIKESLTFKTILSLHQGLELPLFIVPFDAVYNYNWLIKINKQNGIRHKISNIDKCIKSVDSDYFSIKRNDARSYYDVLEKKKFPVHFISDDEDQYDNQMYKKHILSKEDEFIVTGPIGWYGVDTPIIGSPYPGIKRFIRLLCNKYIAFADNVDYNKLKVK